MTKPKTACVIDFSMCHHDTKEPLQYHTVPVHFLVAPVSLPHTFVALLYTPVALPYAIRSPLPLHYPQASITLLYPSLTLFLATK